MQVRHHGLIAPGRHVAMLGEWDPTSPAQEQLFGVEVGAAAANGLPTLVVTFDPSPVGLIMGATTRPPFDDVVSRLALQERCGVSSRVTVRLSRDEVEHAGVVELLDALADHVEIGSLVLGTRQTLGTQQRGNDIAIQAAAASRGIEVRRLPAQERRTTTPDARSALTRGRLARAVELIGHPLLWSIPGSGIREMDWPSGNYLAVPLREPRCDQDREGEAISVRFAESPSGVTFGWPHPTIPWLGFVAGPADPPVRAASITVAVG
jgi:hypothetical protein